MFSEFKDIIDNKELTNNTAQLYAKIKDFLTFVRSDLVSLFVYDEKKQSLNRVLLYNKTEGTLEDSSDPFSLDMSQPEGFIGKAFLTMSPAIYNHVMSDKEYSQPYDNPRGDKFKAQMLVPIVEHDKLLGIIRTSARIRGELKKYTQKDLSLIQSLSPYIAKMIKNISSKQEIFENIQIDQAISQHHVEIPREEKVEDRDMLLSFSNTVHDIRTPANSLYGFLELMEEYTEDKRLKEFIGHAKESAKFINTLTDSILEQAKEKHQKQTSTSTVVNSVKFFAQTADIFSADMSAKNIEYLIYIDPSLPKEIKIDTIKLKRVLVNLLGNAYKFTPKGSRIDFKVKFDAKEQKIKCLVADRGIGIDPARQKDIFKAFEQAEEDTSKHYGGTGLGLSISAKYVNELEGKLKLKSVPGEGSKFYFSFPVKVTNTKPSYEKFKNLKKKITLLTNSKKAANLENIIAYLTELGMGKENIEITDTLPLDTTHLYCFQHKLSPEILRITKERNMKILIIEESLFSLSKNKSLSQYNIISENTYYGDLVHSTTFSEKKKKILIADDNKINITLLKSILETEFVELFTTLDGLETLNLLKEAYDNNSPFDAIFIDKHMPSISGSDVIHNYRGYESSRKTTDPLFAISITGDPNMDKEEKKLYNLIVQKPFNTEAVRAAIAQIK